MDGVVISVMDPDGNVVKGSATAEQMELESEDQLDVRINVT